LSRAVTMTGPLGTSPGSIDSSMVALDALFPGTTIGSPAPPASENVEEIERTPESPSAMAS
jgi:hypothetical protein